jgi:hypothetical protein
MKSKENKAIQDLFIHARTAILTQLKNVIGRSSSNNKSDRLQQLQPFISSKIQFAKK